MSTESRLDSWKERCTTKELVNWFVDKDKYKVGLDKGCTINQIMNDIGFRNPHNDRIFEFLAKVHLRNQMTKVRAYFAKDGFIMSSKKMNAGTPTVYFLIDNLSEERIERHYKLKKNVERSTFRFREDKLNLLGFIHKIKDEKLKEQFKKAYASRLDFSKSLVSEKAKEMLDEPKKKTTEK